MNIFSLLGNELSGNGVGARVSAHQYASDIKNLNNIVQDVYKGFDSKPLVLAPGGFFNAEWFGNFVDLAGKNVEVVTHHIYNLGSGIINKSYKNSVPFKEYELGSFVF